MRGVALSFFLTAVLAATAGMLWGIHMAATKDHLLSPAHGHLNLIGWATMALYGLYYHAVPSAAGRRVFGAPLAWVHYAVSLVGLMIIVPGIVFAVRDNVEGMAATGSLITLAGMLIFLATVVADARSAPAR